MSLLQHPAELSGILSPSRCCQWKSLTMFSWPSFPQWGTPTQGMWSEKVSGQLSSQWGMMGELRVRKTRLWWWRWEIGWEYPRRAGQLNLPASLCSGKCHRMRMAGGAAVASLDVSSLVELRIQEWGAVRWGMTKELKKYRGNGTREAIPLLLTQTQPSLFLCLLMNQRKLPPEPFAFQLLQLCFVSPRFKYSD